MGKWRGILLRLGVPERSLSGRHGPCPMCGGKDRFRFDNKEGKGTWICSQCGAGTGMKLAEMVLGKGFSDTASEIDRIIGNETVGQDQPCRDMGEAERRAALREVYASSQPISKGDVVDRYLAGRGIDEMIYPKALRFAPSLRDGEGGTRPAMVAVVGVYGAERPCTLHRTFLDPSGRKAEMECPRKLMPGPVEDGACVQLSDYHGGPLGIAEGIETAMAASRLWSMPVWSALNAAMLAKWLPPDGCEEVAIFGDNDAKFAGHAAAYRLAQRLAVKGIQVSVHIPEGVGMDWADELGRRLASEVEGMA